MTLTPDARPQLAVDGDPATAWTVAAFSDPVGERIEVTTPEPETTDSITLRQAPGGNRHITQVGLRLDGGEQFTVDLGPESDAGQEVTFPEQTFETLDIEILDVDPHTETFAGFSGVGFAEIAIPGVEPATETVRVPVDLTDAIGDEGTSTEAANDLALTYLFTRLRSSPTDPIRSDDEVHLARIFDVPVERTFTVEGTVRLRADDPNAPVEAVLGLPGAADGGVDITASDVLEGNAAARPAAALDGDRTTAWSPGLGEQTGRFLEFTATEPVTLDGLDLAVVTDGRHSVPTELTVEAGGDTRVVSLSDLEDLPTRGTTTLVSVGFDELTGETVRVTVTGVRPVTTTDYFSGAAVPLPVGIAELGIAGVDLGPLPDSIPPVCREGVLDIDGTPLAVRVSGSTADALAGRPLSFEACDAAAPDNAAASIAVPLSAGTHTLTSGSGSATGLDVDQVVLSAPGAPLPDMERSSTTTPTVELDTADPVSFEATVTGATDPFWLVLGQSHSEGWEATAGGKDLGPPILVDGYANGWYVDPAEVGTDFTVTMTWTPQRWVWTGLALTALGALACLVIIIVGRRSDSGGPDDNDVDSTPALTSPFRSAGPTVHPPAAAGAGVVAALLATVLFSPVIGVVAGVAAGVALATTRGRGLLTVGAVAAFGGSALIVVVQQWRHRYPVDFAWAAHFDLSHGLALLAVALLGADALIQAFRRRRLAAEKNSSQRLRLSGAVPALRKAVGVGCDLVGHHLQRPQRTLGPCEARGSCERALREPCTKLVVGEHTDHRIGEFLSTRGQKSCRAVDDGVDVARDPGGDAGCTAGGALRERETPSLTDRRRGNEPGRSVAVDQVVVGHAAEKLRSSRRRRHAVPGLPDRRAAAPRRRSTRGGSGHVGAPRRRCRSAGRTAWAA